MPVYLKTNKKARVNHMKPPSWELTSPATISIVQEKDIKHKEKERIKVEKVAFDKNAIKEAKKLKSKQAKQQNVVKKKLFQ